jgi:hypothetical protein
LLQGHCGKESDVREYDFAVTKKFLILIPYFSGDRRKISSCA